MVFNLFTNAQKWLTKEYLFRDNKLNFALAQITSYTSGQDIGILGNVVLYELLLFNNREKLLKAVVLNIKFIFKLSNSILI